jgi:hypothetical protein
MKYMPEHVWRSVEKQGRNRFIWKHRVLPFGIPITLLLIALEFLELAAGWRDLLYGRWSAVVYLTLLLGVAITYVIAMVEWDDHKRKYDSPKAP